MRDDVSAGTGNQLLLLVFVAINLMAQCVVFAFTTVVSFGLIDDYGSTQQDTVIKKIISNNNTKRKYKKTKHFIEEEKNCIKGEQLRLDT